MQDQQRQFILSLLAYAVQRGVPAKQLCKLCDINLDRLKKGPLELSVRQYNDLWHQASKLTNDPLFGLHFGESLQLAALGVVGEIIKSSETVGQAITIACSLTAAVTDLFTIEVSRSHKTFSIQLIRTVRQANEFVERQLADLLMVFAVHELNGFILEKIQPQSVTLPYKPENKEAYQRVFRCQSIKTGPYALAFSNRYWDEPILTANHEIQKQYVEKISARYGDKLTVSTRFKEIVLNYLMRNSYLGVLSLEDIAANFSMTPRSLQRKLQEEGTTFQQLSDVAKKSLAIHFMSTGKYQVKEISMMLGYNELSAFSRAFKRWTGKSPMNY